MALGVYVISPASKPSMFRQSHGTGTYFHPNNGFSTRFSDAKVVVLNTKQNLCCCCVSRECFITPLDAIPAALKRFPEVRLWAQFHVLSATAIVSRVKEWELRSPERQGRFVERVPGGQTSIRLSHEDRTHCKWLSSYELKRCPTFTLWRYRRSATASDGPCFLT